MDPRVYIRPDIALVMKAGWHWASRHSDPGLDERLKVVCAQATLRYTRHERKKAFAQAALTCWIAQN